MSKALTWEQRKLGDVLSEYHERNKKDGTYSHLSLTKEGVVPKSERYDREALVTHINKEYRVTHLNDICYNPANLKFGVICRNTFGTGIFSPIYITFSVNTSYDPLFVEALITRNSFIQSALKYQEGTVYERMAVKPLDLLNIIVLIPNETEQQRIGTFIQCLNHLITLHQRKLDHLKDLKKGLLQQMFV